MLPYFVLHLLRYIHVLVEAFPVYLVIIPAEGLSHWEELHGWAKFCMTDLPLSSRLDSRLSSLSPDAKITLGIQFSLFTEVIRLKSRYLGTPNYPFGIQKSVAHSSEPRSKSSKSYAYAPRSSPEISRIGVWKFRIQVLYGVFDAFWMRLGMKL